MTIGILYLDFLLPEARSLKDKRRIVKSMKQQMRNRYNCSIAETEYHDMWQRTRIVACVVSNESTHANTQLNEIARFAHTRPGADLADYWIEMI